MVRCCFSECTKSSYFGPIDGSALYCAGHRQEGMINLLDRVCEVDGCLKRAGYNTLGEKGKRFCVDHKTEGMVNLNLRRCLHVGCIIFPHYNTLGKKKGDYCFEHKLDGMMNVVTLKCLHEGCDLTAQYNAPDLKKGLYCSIHKLDGMIDVKHKRCEHEGCSYLPSYAYSSDTQSRYCSKHALEGMQNKKHKKCTYEGCGKVPSFGLEKGVALYCLDHKTLDSFDVTHKMCEDENCHKRPIFNFAGSSSGRFCTSHKVDGMVNLLFKPCVSEWCYDTGYFSGRNGYCLHCYIHLFPEKPIARNYKTKEKAVVDCILGEFTGKTWICDKRIQDGCSRRRPDMLLDLGNQVVIIEVDENQHAQYDCSCENKRLMELSQDVGHRSIVFIRFNPDDYVDQIGQTIKSCWTLNKKGIVSVNSKNLDLWTKRLAILKDQVQYWINQTTEKTVEVIELFYDAIV